MAANVHMKRVSVNVHQDGQDPIVVSPAQTERLVLIVDSSANVTTMLAVGKTMDSASVKRAGWDSDAMKSAQKDSMEITVWNRAIVHWEISFATRL